ncbi:MAG TPA: DUF885 domain-containing protein [Pyrinomonadaceae bacterium]|nr:DUF885 domain-containing protein [Pyrinomonadaceae bacterium]
MKIRKALLLITALSLCAHSMTGTLALSATQAADRRFEALARSYIEKLLEMEPERATQLGDHRYDNRLNDYSMEGVRRSRAFTEQYLRELERIRPARLSPANSIDYRILRSRLEYNLFQIDVLREYEWNPLSYNVGNAIYGLLARDFAPLKVRLRNVRGRLLGVPSVVEAARANLKNPPRVHTETAISQNKGTINLIRNELDTFARQEPEARNELLAAQTAAVQALEDYGRWLEKELLPRSTGDFRLGEEKYRRKLAFALDSDMTKEEILSRGLADLKSTQDAMYELALPLYRNFFPKESDAARLADKKLVIKSVLARLAEKRPNNDTIVGLAERTLKETTDFVRSRGIVTVPDEPVKIIVMPEFQRGVAVAYCSPAPPLEPQGETFYAISPTPKDWSSARVDSFFREYNNYMVHNLTIHEAMPGHYLQLAHSNRFKAPTLIRAIFRSGTFAEGWGVYAEQLMAEAGYGGPEVRLQQLKMRLRTIINAIIDQKIHTAGMTEKDALALMMDEGFQEEGEAAGKWTRARLTSTQLSTYYVGVLEMNDIRRAYEAKMKGRRIDYKELHNTMLSFGTPPPKYVREMMKL